MLNITTDKRLAIFVHLSRDLGKFCVKLRFHRSAFLMTMEYVSVETRQRGVPKLSVSKALTIIAAMALATWQSEQTAELTSFCFSSPSLTYTLLVGVVAVCFGRYNGVEVSLYFLGNMTIFW